MLQPLRHVIGQFNAATRLGLALVVAYSGIGAAPTGLGARGTPGDGVQSPAAAIASSGTFQDFDVPGMGTLYVSGIHAGAAGPQLIPGGPTGVGNFIRLAFTTTVPSQTSIAFPRTDSGAFDQVVADFDFRLSPNRTANDRGDGFGFALLNTTSFGITGTVAPQPPLYAGEEPNFTNSLGVGFDLYRSGPPLESNNNHLSLHFNNNKLGEFRAPFDLGVGEWIHARIVMRPAVGFSDVTVSLTPCGGPTTMVIDRFVVAGLTPYEGRAWFAARSGGLSAEHDIDNVHVQFLGLSQNLIAFDTSCQAAVETGGSAVVAVTRTGNVSAPATVTYSTTDVSAVAGADYTAITDSLVFNSGETTKSISIPLLDDASNEGDESFLVTLNTVSGKGAVIGGPAVARVTIVDDERSMVSGHWSEVIPLPVVPIHLHLLPTGQVLFWDRHHDTFGWDGNPRLWDPASGALTMAQGVNYDLFCAGHSFLADGRLLVTGGHISDTVGDDEASLYNPFTDTWSRLPVMNGGRWYPSNVTLATGEVLVMAGTKENGLNPVPQVWQPTSNTWRDLTTAQHAGYPTDADYYPFLYQAPNGLVFDAGPQRRARYLNPAGTGSWSSTDVATSTVLYRDYGSSVMHEPGKVLIVGGNPREPNPNDPPTIVPSASAEVIDLNGGTPAWRSVDSMFAGRRHLTTTLLPDGTVLATGGSSLPGFDNPAGAVLPAEVWDPATEQWTTLAAQTRYRGYHSTALLLPDGRVLVGGGGHPDPAGGAQLNFEIYSPPYLFKGPRPQITSAPSLVTYGQTINVQTSDAAMIQLVTWLRLGSVTHAFNQNQRFNRLSFSQSPNGLSVTTPANANLAPPGHYLLFILNNQGVPSVARIVLLASTIHPVYLPVIYRMN